MRDVFTVVAESLKRGMPCALATLVEAYNSSPAPIGTSVAVDAQGSISGTIGAGCSEGEIVGACLETLIDGDVRVVAVNLEEDDAVTGSSACGGQLRILVWRPETSFAATARAIGTGNSSVTLELPRGFSIDIPAKRRLILVGATSLAQEIARIAKSLDFSVTVVDPRPAFATAERIPDAAELVREWPDEFLPRSLTADTSILVLSHDPKFDLPALRCALRSQAPYIGLLGSRRSQAARRQALIEEGASPDEIARIHGPAGMDLGGRSMGETALSILAQIVALRNGRDGTALDRSSGAIHSSSASVSTSKYAPSSSVSTTRRTSSGSSRNNLTVSPSGKD